MTNSPHDPPDHPDPHGTDHHVFVPADAHDDSPAPWAITSDQANHHDDVPRAAYVNLNDRFVDQLDEAGLTAYVQALVAAADVAAAGEGQDAVAERLDAGMRAAGFPMAPVHAEQLVDRLLSAHGVVHIAAYGKVIHGDPALDVARFEPHVVGTEDPANPDRPFYT